MPTVTLTGRSDLFPVGTTVGIYAGNSQRPAPGPPTSPAIATGVVDAAGNLSVTNAGILQGVRYSAYANVGGIDVSTQVRSTLDVSDTGKGIGTATLNSTTALTLVSATVGAFAIGQRITGPGIPAGTYLIAGSGANWTMSAAATASGAGVAIQAEGASPAVVPPDKGVGALAVPVPVTTWRAKVAQRRAIIGTS